MNIQDAAQQRFEQAVFDYSKVILKTHLERGGRLSPSDAYGIVVGACTMAEALETKLDEYDQQNRQQAAPDAQ